MSWTVGLKRVEELADARVVELLTALNDGLGEGGADAAPFVAKQGKQTDGGCAQMWRRVFESGDADWCEDHRQAADEHDPGPDNLGWCDIEVHHRHPVIAGGHDKQADGDQPAGVGASSEYEADDHQHHDREDT